MKTFVPKVINWSERKWYILDATWKKPWKIAAVVANILRWKNKTSFTHHIDNWDYVIITNCESIAISEKKKEEKKYYRHSRYAKDWLKVVTAKQKLEKDPEFVLWHTIKWMIPNNKLKTEMIKRLKLFVWNDHDHISQNPEIININN